MTGSTVSVDGAVPWLHLSLAPLTTSFGILEPFLTIDSITRPTGIAAGDAIVSR
jgi:hypothetical protein